MTEQSEHPAGLWEQVVSILTSSTATAELGIAPLRPQHKALLRSVTHTGDFPGFFLLSTESQVVQTLVRESLKPFIETVLHSLTGEEIEVVIAHDDASEDGEDSAAPAHTPPAPTAQQTMRHNNFGPMTGARTSAAESESQETAHSDHGTGPGASGQLQFPATAATAHPLAASHSPSPAPTIGSHLGDTAASGDSRHTDGTHTPPTISQLQTQSPFHSGTHGTPHQMSRPFEEPTLNPNHTFETFVIGPQNKFAAAAAVAVAEAPGRTYNPLFISGGSGLGKTHLLHGIGHYAKNLYPNLRVRYVSSEEFTNDFINSVRDDAQDSFKRRYRDLDMLIIDDIQFLAGKEGTQEEFFHTFNALHQANRQIVLSSDKPARELKTLEDRLRTRFESGLNPDLQFPDLETRIAILSKKAQLSNLKVDQDVLEYIAQNTSSSIRELEGRLLQVSAHASMMNEPVTVKFAQDILGGDEVEITITPEIIIATTADYFDLSVADLIGPGKTRPVAHARQIAVYLTRTFTELSLPLIGREFGNRDHTTMLHAHNKIRKEIAANKPAKDQVNDLTTRIRERARQGR